MDPFEHNTQYHRKHILSRSQAKTTLVPVAIIFFSFIHKVMELPQ